MMGLGVFDGFGMLLGGLLWIALVALVVWGTVRLFSRQGEAEQDTALQILKRRYASGEMSTAEYQQAKEDLG